MGTPIAVTILQQVCGTIQVIQFGWRQSPWILPTIRRTLVVLDHGCTRSTGSRKAIRRFQRCALYYGVTTEFCLCNKSFVFANSVTETCREHCIIHFPTKPPCSASVDVLETGDIPILFSLPQMQNLGIPLDLDPKGAKITCPALACTLLPTNIPQWDILSWILTSLAYQPKSRERSDRPTKRVTLALSQRK